MLRGEETWLSDLAAEFLDGQASFEFPLGDAQDPFASDGLLLPPLTFPSSSDDSTPAQQVVAPRARPLVVRGTVPRSLAETTHGSKRPPATRRLHSVHFHATVAAEAYALQTQALLPVGPRCAPSYDNASVRCLAGIAGRAADQCRSAAVTKRPRITRAAAAAVCPAGRRARPPGPIPAFRLRAVAGRRAAAAAGAAVNEAGQRRRRIRV